MQLQMDLIEKPMMEHEVVFIYYYVTTNYGSYTFQMSECKEQKYQKNYDKQRERES